MGCPNCGSRISWLAPWRALRGETVLCARCGQQLSLAGDIKLIRKRMVIAMEIAVALSIAVAFLPSPLLAVAAFGLIQVAHVMYLYGALFRWRPLRLDPS